MAPGTLQEVTQSVNEQTAFRVLFSQLSLRLLGVWSYGLFGGSFGFSTPLPRVKTVVPLVSSIRVKIRAGQSHVQCHPTLNVNLLGIHSAPDCPVPEGASTFSRRFSALNAYKEVSFPHLPVRDAAQHLRLRLRLRLSAGVLHKRMRHPCSRVRRQNRFRRQW